MKAEEPNNNEPPVPPDQRNEPEPESNDILPSEEEVEEYEVINSTLDQLQQCLDVLEHKNDMLNAQLLELLESSRQARQEVDEASMQTDQSTENSEGNGGSSI